MINTKQVIEVCTDYIEKNLNNKILLDDISEDTGVSKYYLLRMFKALTGDTLIDYVQSRKLSSSINELINTNMRIIDIALDYGFDHEQSYIRAFRKKFGYTPQKVRSNDLTLEIKERFNINDLISLNNTVTCRPFYVFKKKMNLVGIKNKIMSKSGDNSAALLGREFFHNKKQAINNAVDNNIYYGYTDWNGWNGHDDGYIYYVPSLQVPDLSDIPVGMTGISIPAHKYVVFRFVGFCSPEEIQGRQVGRLLVHMYRKWIMNSGFKPADTFRLEYINTSISSDNYCELDIYQPIVNV